MAIPKTAALPLGYSPVFEDSFLVLRWLSDEPAKLGTIKQVTPNAFNVVPATAPSLGFESPTDSYPIQSSNPIPSDENYR